MIMEATIVVNILKRYNQANPECLLSLLQTISSMKNFFHPFKIANEHKMQILPTLIKLAVFLGAIIKNGINHRDNYRKKRPRQNKATKYGYILTYSVFSATVPFNYSK